MKLRPHHLLCVQGYEGKGYSKEFIDNMSAVTNYLLKNTDSVFELVFSTDDICKKCPNKTRENLCEKNDWVEHTDRKVADYFNLREKKYIYSEVLREIDSRITELVLENICSGCSWYPISACRKNILSK